MSKGSSEIEIDHVVPLNLHLGHVSETNYGLSSFKNMTSGRYGVAGV